MKINVFQKRTFIFMNAVGYNECYKIRGSYPFEFLQSRSNTYSMRIQSSPIGAYDLLTKIMTTAQTVVSNPMKT